MWCIGWTYDTIISYNQFDSVWASSPGGPGLNFGEQIAGRSILGTGVQISLAYTMFRRGYLTNEALIRSCQVRLCDLRLDPTDHGRFAHSN